MLKKIALVGAGLILIGFGGIVATAAVHKQNLQDYLMSAVGSGIKQAQNGDFNPATQNFDKSGAVSAQGVTSVEVSGTAARVHIYPGSTNQISAHAYGYVGGVTPNDFTFSVEKRGNQAIVQLIKKPGLVFGSTIQLKMDVTLPKQQYDELNAQVSAGQVMIENLSAKSFTLHSSAGSVDASNLTGQVQATSSAGAVTVTNITGDVNLQSSAGSVTARSVSGNIQAHSSAGSVQIYLQDITHNITADSAAGSVRVTTANVPTALQFSLHATAGSVHFGLPGGEFTTKDHGNIEGTIGQGGPTLQVESSAGSVDVSQGAIS